MEIPYLLSGSVHRAGCHVAINSVGYGFGSVNSPAVSVFDCRGAYPGNVGPNVGFGYTDRENRLLDKCRASIQSCSSLPELTGGPDICVNQYRDVETGEG